MKKFLLIALLIGILTPCYGCGLYDFNCRLEQQRQQMQYDQMMRQQQQMMQMQQQQMIQQQQQYQQQMQQMRQMQNQYQIPTYGYQYGGY